MITIEQINNNIINRINKEQINNNIKDLLCNSKYDSNKIIQLQTSHLIISFIDFDLFKELIELYSVRKINIKLKDFLVQTASNIHNNYPKQIEEYTLELITSEKGYKRIIGRSLWDCLKLVESDFNILSYSEDFQAKFSISILQDLLFPQNRLPKLLPLFNSPSEEIRKILIISLSKYTINYYCTVKTEIEKSKYQETKELKLFTLFLSRIQKQYKLSCNCLELHSEYLYPDIFEIAQRSCTDKMRKQFKIIESTNNHSILNLLNKIQLGRGGGWRDEDGTVHKLGHFSFSQELPMMLNSLTPLEMKEFMLDIEVV